MVKATDECDREVIKSRLEEIQERLKKVGGERVAALAACVKAGYDYRNKRAELERVKERLDQEFAAVLTELLASKDCQVALAEEEARLSEQARDCQSRLGVLTLVK